MKDVIAEITAAGAAASEAYGADIFLFSGSIEDDSLGELAEIVTQHFSGREKCILILATNGGSANGAFRIARFFQRTYDEFWLCCPGSCKSAGTLVALGANGLIMDHFSELGPLDVQIVKEDELGARKSGLLATSTFDALADQTFSLYSTLMTRIKVSSYNQISFKLASQLAADMTAQTIGNLYNQMNPEVIGSERRSLLIAKRYGQLLTENSDNVRNSHTVDHFVSCYPSHDFVIDDEEAKKWFKNVELPSEELYRLLALLGSIAREEAHQTLAIPLSPKMETDDEDDDEGEGPANGTDLHSSEGQIDEGHSEDSVPADGANTNHGGTPPVDESGSADSAGDAEQANGAIPGSQTDPFQTLRPN